MTNIENIPNDNEKSVILYILILHIIAAIYSAALIIYHPFGDTWGIAYVGIGLCVPNIAILSYLLLYMCINERKEIDRINNEKTWIDKALEQKIGGYQK